MKPLEDRNEKSTKFYLSEDNKIMLTSYVDKKHLEKIYSRALNKT